VDQLVAKDEVAEPQTQHKSVDVLQLQFTVSRNWTREDKLVRFDVKATEDAKGQPDISKPISFRAAKREGISLTQMRPLLAS
jgi:hypothetical protein